MRPTFGCSVRSAPSSGKRRHATYRLPNEPFTARTATLVAGSRSSPGRATTSRCSNNSGSARSLDLTAWLATPLLRAEPRVRSSPGNRPLGSDVVLAPGSPSVGTTECAVARNRPVAPSLVSASHGLDDRRGGSRTRSTHDRSSTFPLRTGRRRVRASVSSAQCGIDTQDTSITLRLLVRPGYEEAGADPLARPSRRGM